jgi:hypothetical protein
MRVSRCAWVGLSLLLEGCAGFSIWPSTPQKGAPIVEKHGVAGTSLTPSQITAYMAEVSKLDGPSLDAEIKRLQAGARGSAGDRLKLAYLLSREGSVVRARRLMEGLPDTFDDPGTREIARLVQRVVKLQQDLLQERRKASDLQSKIDQLMSLEQTLQQHRPSRLQGAP